MTFGSVIADSLHAQNEILREILSVGILGNGFFTERIYADGVFPGTYP